MQTDSVRVDGGVGLQGKVSIQGSKNAALPILAATLLTKGNNYICNCPKITDIYQMKQLLKAIGCKVGESNEYVCVNGDSVQCKRMPTEAIRGMRSSVCMLGALLSRCHEVVMEYPGGCVIGERPIDLHLKGLEALGAEFEMKEGLIYGKVKERFRGAEVVFPKVSVGATENVVLAAVLAEGKTRIVNAAREPEVIALCEYLCKCGANIRGMGKEILEITGVEELQGATMKIPGDRIVAGTYLFAVLGIGENALLEKAPTSHMERVIKVAEDMGAICQVTKEGLYVQAPYGVKPIGYLRTGIYPEFPTDLQSVALVAALAAKGESIIEERIFENRFRIVEPLKTMGAKVEILSPDKVLVRGGYPLFGSVVEAQELRGGAALVNAGLMAEGVTIVKGYQYIRRGYENICKDLRELGARVTSV